MSRIYHFNDKTQEWEKSDGNLIGVPSGDGAVESVNGKTGKVELTAEDVKALPNRPPTEATLGGVLAKVETPSAYSAPISSDALGHLFVKGADEILATDKTTPSNGWNYIKYKSGLAVCWKKISVTATLNNPTGNGFRSESIKATPFPFAFIDNKFISIPFANYSDSFFWVVSGTGATKDDTGTRYLMTNKEGKSAETAIFFEFALGWWKQ